MFPLGQNNFNLFGLLTISPEKNPIVTVQDIPYVQAVLSSGSPNQGEVHPVLITGEAANIAYDWFNRRPSGFFAIAQGGLKTYNNTTRPVVRYLSIYELLRK